MATNQDCAVAQPTRRLVLASQRMWAAAGGRDAVRGAFAPLAPDWVGEKGLALAGGQLCALFCARGLCMASWSTWH